MTAIPHTIDSDPLAEPPASSIQAYARVTGLLLVLSMIFGFLGELYIPSRFMSADAAETARNIATSQPLYRFAFAAYLVEAICDIGLSLLFYVLLRPVSKPVALAAAFFGLVSTAIYAIAETFYFAPTLLLSGAPYLKAFSPDQVNALVMLSLKLFSRVGMMFMALYGIATFLRGYLIARSGYLPNVVGILLMFAGVGFAAKNVTIVLAPAYSSNLFLAPMFFAQLTLVIWMLVKGVEVAQWEARAAAGRAPVRTAR